MTLVPNFRGELNSAVETDDGPVRAVYIWGGKLSLSYNDEELAVDGEGNAFVTISWEHYLVHAGEMFHAEHFWGDLANGAHANLRLVTGDKEVHIVAAGSVGGKCLAFLYEDADLAGGTPVPIYNMNRESGHIPAVALYHTPTVNGTGSKALVNSRLIPGGSGPAVARVGASERLQTEWELKPSTEYLLRLTNDSGGAIDVSQSIEFYETG